MWGVITHTPPRDVSNATIYFRCCIFRDGFFMMLRFYNLVPYVSILKTFHIKI